MLIEVIPFIIILQQLFGESKFVVTSVPV